MRPMSEMQVICIDVTTRCFYQCSGCTRLIGHVKTRDMDLNTFKLAIDSMEGHRGLLGVIGGEPIFWPHLDAATDYLVQKTGGPIRLPRNIGIDPIPDLSKFLLSHYHDVKTKRGIFTSLPPKTIDHWEKLLESYHYFGFNTHENAGLHQQLLVASGELPIPKDQKEKMIQDCWINKFWSCSITPQGCWPCEIMGTLAHAFDGPGPKQGWPIEKGWWNRQPKDWGDMMKWCEICGAAMDVPRLKATDDQEIVSAENYERLKKIGSTKVDKGVVKVFDTAGYDPDKYKVVKSIEWYLPTKANGRPDDESRAKGTATNLNPKKLECVIVSVGYSDFLDQTLPWNIRHFDKCVIVTASSDTHTQEIAKKHGACVVISDSYKEKGAQFNKGKMLNAGIAALDYDDWAMFTDADILLPPDFRTEFNRQIWNPGVLYYGTRLHSPRGDVVSWVDNYKRNPNLINSLKLVNTKANQMPWGYLQIFHNKAHTLSRLGRNICSEAFFSAAGIDNHFMNRWHPHKRCLTNFQVIHIDHGAEKINWNGRRSPSLAAAPIKQLITNDGWTALGWIDELGYHDTYPLAPGGFIKLFRSDTGEFVIMHNDSPPRGGYIQDEGFKYGGHHIGFVTDSYKFPVDLLYKGKIIIHQAGKFEYSGWGAGHVMFEDNRQGYVWNGQEISPTVFELFQKSQLGPNDVPLIKAGSVYRAPIRTGRQRVR